MKIKVTEQHIKNGKPYDPCKCPIALAIYDVTGEQCCVGGMICREHDVGEFKHIIPSKEVRLFISEFDHERAVQPCEFDIPLEELGLKCVK